MQKMAVLAITMLCLLLSNLHMQSQSFHNRRREVQHLLDLELPRKLRISEKLPSKLEKVSSSKEEEDELGVAVAVAVASKEEQIREINGNGEWDENEDDDPLEHFTMDYTSVKRRRPIHNMSTQHP